MLTPFVSFSQLEDVSNDALLRELIIRGVDLESEVIQDYLGQMNGMYINKVRTLDTQSEYNKLALDYIRRSNVVSTSNALSLLKVFGVPLAELIADLIPYLLEVVIYDTPQNMRVFKWARYGKKMYRDNLELREKFGR